MPILSDTQWGATLHLNVVRLISASITWGWVALIALAAGIIHVMPGEATPVLGFMFAPAAMLFVGLTGILICKFIAAIGVPYVDLIGGMLSIVMVVFIVAGDPLIWGIRRFYPTIVPVERFNALNLQAVILVNKL